MKSTIKSHPCYEIYDEIYFHAKSIEGEKVILAGDFWLCLRKKAGGEVAKDENMLSTDVVVPVIIPFYQKKLV